MNIFVNKISLSEHRSINATVNCFLLTSIKQAEEKSTSNLKKFHFSSFSLSKQQTNKSVIQMKARSSASRSFGAEEEKRKRKGTTKVETKKKKNSRQLKQMNLKANRNGKKLKRVYQIVIWQTWYKTKLIYPKSDSANEWQQKHNKQQQKCPGKSYSKSAATQAQQKSGSSCRWSDREKKDRRRTMVKGLPKEAQCNSSKKQQQ